MIAGIEMAISAKEFGDNEIVIDRTFVGLVEWRSKSDFCRANRDLLSGTCGCV